MLRSLVGSEMCIRDRYLMTESQQIPAFLRRFGGVTSVNVSQSDIRPVVRAELNNLKRDIRNGLSRTSNNLSRYHLQDALERIDAILDPKG